MDTAYFYLGLSGLLAATLWVPYILARVFVWGLPTFLLNYPKGFPAQQPEPPLWAQRSQRAHLNMIETMPGFVAVVLAAGYFVGSDPGKGILIAQCCQIFFFARVAHAIVYTLGIPVVRTPIFVVSWASIVVIASTFLPIPLGH